MRKIIFCVGFLAFTTILFSQNCPPSNQSGVHVVQKGETLYRISKMYGTSVDNILALNGRSINQVLSICTPLRVYSTVGNTSTVTTASPPPTTTTYTPPTTTTTYTPPPTTTYTPPPANTSTTSTPVDYSKGGRPSKPYHQYQEQEKGVHYVQGDENIHGIALLYGYTVERFREFNGIATGADVVTGQILRTTDCDCLNTVTDSDDEKVNIGTWTEVNTGSTGTATTNSGGKTWTNGNSGATNSGTSPNTGWSNNTTTTTNTSSSNISTSAPVSFDRARASYMRSEELQMIDEINLIRSNPQGYISHVQRYIKYLQNNGSFGNSIQTAVELIDELRTTQPLNTLKPKQCLYNTAVNHGKDAKRNGTSSHQGSDGSWPWDRILKGCPDLQDGNENLVGGPDDIRRAVMLLLVDDGIPNRGHRKAILNPAWKYVACHKVGTIGSMPNSWVQNFAY